MATHLCTRMSTMSLSAHRPPPSFSFASSVRGCGLNVGRPQAASVGRQAFLIEAKQNAKKRQRVSEKQRLYNKPHKSAIATRMKKVFKALEELPGSVESEEVLKPIEKLISEAYQEVDKAVSKGVLHDNTGARRKQRLAVAKQAALIRLGLYTPA